MNGIFVRHFYRLVSQALHILIRPGDSVSEIEPIHKHLSTSFGRPLPRWIGKEKGFRPDYLVLNGNIHYERDIQKFLDQLGRSIDAHSRLVLITYGVLWRPFILLATWLGLRARSIEENWLDETDVRNFLELSGFELIRTERKVLIPIPFFFLDRLANRFLAPLPVIRNFCLIRIAIARKLEKPFAKIPSVSVVVPARNEAGNIEEIIRRIPSMGPRDEIIFVEGHSKDQTWKEILAAKKRHPKRRIKCLQQKGIGKGDAVREGFAVAENEILIIQDADMTAPPEDLPRFAAILASGKAEFANGSRLVYPMEKEAMRFFNILGNRFFAMSFSAVLGQPLKDTLCGTKAISRLDYERLSKNRAYFGNFDPFGDFDLLFGAARMGLRIREIPVLYRARTYGDTNIQRWRHGVLLLRMLVFAIFKFVFV